MIALQGTGSSQFDTLCSRANIWDRANGLKEWSHDALDFCHTTFRLEIKSDQSTPLNFSWIEDITKTYRINSLISFMTTPQFNLKLRTTCTPNLSETLMLNRFRLLQHNYRNCRRFDCLKYLNRKWSFPTQKQRSRSLCFNKRFEIELRSILLYA